MDSHFISVIAISDEPSALAKFRAKVASDRVDQSKNRRGRPNAPAISFQKVVPVLADGRDELAFEQMRAWGCVEPEGDETWGPHDETIGERRGLRWELICTEAPFSLFKQASDANPEIVFAVARAEQNSDVADIKVFHRGECAYEAELSDEERSTLFREDDADDTYVEDRAIEALVKRAQEAMSQALEAPGAPAP